MSLSEKQKLIRVAYLKHRFADPSLAYDNYSDEDLAFEKMSEEMLADSKRNLQNPRMTGCDPHKSPGKGSGDGECYQVHQDYGKAKSGENGSPKRRKYMVKYRKKYYDSKNKKPKDGMATRKIVPKPYPKKTPPKHPIGKLDRSKVEKKKKEEMSKKAQLISELHQERMGLLKMAYENPSLRGEIMPLLKKKAAPAYRKNTGDPKGADKACEPLKQFKDWTQESFDDYFKDLFSGEETRGNCYNIYNQYGESVQTGKSDQPRLKYHKWYNENVRGRGGKTPISPLSNGRSKENARKMIERVLKIKIEDMNKFLIGYIKHLKKDRGKSVEEIREIIGPFAENFMPARATAPKAKTKRVKKTLGGRSQTKTPSSTPAPTPSSSSSSSSSSSKTTPSSGSGSKKKTRRRRKTKEK